MFSVKIEECRNHSAFRDIVSDAGTIHGVEKFTAEAIRNMVEAAYNKGRRDKATEIKRALDIRS